MNVDEVERVVEQAIRKRKLIELDYVRQDGTQTRRLMEPYEVSPGTRSKTGEPKFWGWCLEHERVEQRTPGNIISMRVTDETYDPERHRQFFVPRDVRASESRV